MKRTALSSLMLCCCLTATLSAAESDSRAPTITAENHVYAQPLDKDERQALAAAAAATDPALAKRQASGINDNEGLWISGFAIGALVVFVVLTI